MAQEKKKNKFGDKPKGQNKFEDKLKEKRKGKESKKKQEDESGLSLSERKRREIMELRKIVQESRSPSLYENNKKQKAISVKDMKKVEEGDEEMKAKKQLGIEKEFLNLHGNSKTNTRYHDYVHHAISQTATGRNSSSSKNYSFTGGDKLKSSTPRNLASNLISSIQISFSLIS